MARIRGEKTRPADDSKADAWDKLANKTPDETLANRDVFMNQQLDRSKIQARVSRTTRTVATAMLSAIVFVITWVALSLVGWVFGSLLGTLNTDDAGAAPEQGFGEALFALDTWKVLLSLLVALIVFGVSYMALMRNLDAQNLMNDTTDINQYQGDQHIALPEELVRRFDWFPDVGAHSSVQVSSMISHVMLVNKGLKKVEVARRAAKDVVDSDGEVEYIKGEILLDKHDEPIVDELPLVDEKFGEDLFDASGLPQDKKLRRRFDATTIPYNPEGQDHDKWGPHKTVADLINSDWNLPEYEVQRPAGAYIVDTTPVNTMVLAITRAGKGQTYIEPVIDMWLREKRPNNMVINDPKGELLVKHYVRAAMRGFQVVQFNLINAMKTDIYNPLGLAAEAAREGDIIKCAQYVENIADVFFPADGGDDPFWANAANNAFKRVAYGLIDFYMEEERKLRAEAERDDMHPKVLETRLDEMWGKVTLYNCYQLFTELTAKKKKNPRSQLDADYKAGKYGSEEEGTFQEERYAADREIALEREPLWNGAPEMDLLSLYFSATEQLPRNSIRTLIMNANNSLKAMGGADKTIATVYGIAITAMSFFTDPTIMRLTSGTPSQNTDLGGLSFPRRLGVRFSPDYLNREHIVGMQACWQGYADASFTESLGEDFYHEDTVSPEGWARYYFIGKFPESTAYIKLEIRHPQTGLLIKTFHFQFTKDHQTSLSGRYYVTDPVTGSKLVKNGVIVELTRNAAGTFSPGHTTFPQLRLSTKVEDGSTGEPVKTTSASRAIIQTMVRYSEAPKAVFLVTPPHLMKYAKLLLILIKQLVDLNFDKAYMTKSNQKPLYKTRFMLDELGNLQSEGHGIAGFETMLSIGLGQEQQFTIILQTLQQLRDVYGESVDKIVQGNTSNIVFLKSTDDSMLDTLQKMSGTRHVVYRDSKTVTKDVEKIIKFGSIEGKVSYTMTAKEEPVISYNDMAFISERNSILFRAGDAPVWNRNETILPMSWRLFKDTITHPGHEYTLQTIPTLSSVADYDVRRNQPDFFRMLELRIEQALHAGRAKEQYRKAFGYTDVDVSRLDPDIYSDSVMDLINDTIANSRVDIAELPEMDEGNWMELLPFAEYEDNVEQQQAILEAEQQQADRQMKRYAEGMLSREDLGPALDRYVIDAYVAAASDMHASLKHFSTGADGSLRSADGTVTYISKTSGSDAYRQMEQKAAGGEGRVFAEDGAVNQLGSAPMASWQVSGEFYRYLGSLSSWQDIAGGEFDRLLAGFWRQKEAESLND